MSWVIASGFTCFVIGLVYPKLHVEDGEFGKKDMILFNIYQVVANAIAWVIIAPVLDILIYAEPASLVFVQGVYAAVVNAISAGVIGTILLKLYSKTRASKGSLSKEA
jgi:energy-coupling factor transport system substrate-specific component